MIQARVIWEEGISREKITRPDRPTGKPVGYFLVIVVEGRALPTLGGAGPRQVVLGAIIG